MTLGTPLLRRDGLRKVGQSVGEGLRKVGRRLTEPNPDALRRITSPTDDELLDLALSMETGPLKGIRVRPLEFAGPKQASKEVTLFHGSPGRFEQFDPTRATETGLGGKGHYFLDNSIDAKRAYGPHLMAVRVPREKILDLSSETAGKLPHGGVVDDQIRALGFEGTFNPNTREYVLYNPPRAKILAAIAAGVGLSGSKDRK